MNFEERSQEMGLTNMGQGCFHYADRYGEVAYRSLKTKNGVGIVDEEEVPLLGVFTKGIQATSQYQYSGVISDSYKFIGHDFVNNSIRESILGSGNPILREYTILSEHLTTMRNEIVIRNSSNVPQVGDVYPQLVITNCYNGNGAVNISFGISMNEGSVNRIGFGFKTKLGSIRQVHISGSNSSLISAIGGYVSTFSQSIGNLIQENFNNILTQGDMLKVLGLVEKMGKKRRKEISAYLASVEKIDLDNESQSGIQSWGIPSWNMFLALTKFSSMEKNLNAKLLLESIAERVLVVPDQMSRVLESIND